MRYASMCQWFSRGGGIATLLSLLLFTAGVARAYDFRVVDDETGAPIAGAAVIAYWDRKEGPTGLAPTEVKKIIELTTDQDGRFRIPKSDFPFSPDAAQLAMLAGPYDSTLKVYKPGYVGWSSKAIFCGFTKMKSAMEVYAKKRTGFEWKDQEIRLARFKEKYSHKHHVDFLDADGLPSRYPKDAGGGGIKFEKMFAGEYGLSNQEDDEYRARVEMEKLMKKRRGK